MIFSFLLGQRIGVELLSQIVNLCLRNCWTVFQSGYTVLHSQQCMRVFIPLHLCQHVFSSVQFSCSVVSDSLQPPWTVACQASLSITKSQSLPKLMSIELVMPSNHLILCHSLLLLPSIFPNILSLPTSIFTNESALHIRWPKYWSFSFKISLSNEHPGLISFRLDWLDLLAVQGTLESSPTPQFKSINSLALSLLYSPTLTSIHDYWKNHSLD